LEKELEEIKELIKGQQQVISRMTSAGSVIFSMIPPFILLFLLCQFCFDYIKTLLFSPKAPKTSDNNEMHLPPNTPITNLKRISSDEETKSNDKLTLFKSKTLKDLRKTQPNSETSPSILDIAQADQKESIKKLKSFDLEVKPRKNEFSI